LRGFDLAACFALEGFRANAGILDPAVLTAHPQPGQIIATRHMRRLLDGSALFEPDAPRFLQDPLSFRCAPQVHGAAYDALGWVWSGWEIELNSVQDNPVVDVTFGRLVSHGNMDGTLLTLGMDTLRSALATVVDISAQRLHKLHWPAFSGLPSGLTEADSPLGGVQFLNLSHIAEAYAATVRARARPSLLNYQGQLADGVEDHATLLPHSVTETEQLIEAAWVVQALELTVACWALKRRGLTAEALGAGLRDVYAEIEPRLPIGREGGEVFDLRPIVDLVANAELVDLIDAAAPPVPEFPARS
jgi:histidine ammonia-lyase